MVLSNGLSGRGRVEVLSMNGRAMNVTRMFFLGVLCVAFSGCDETKEEREARSMYWPREEVAVRYVGKLTDDEVTVVRAKLSQTKFPAPAFTVAKMLPSPLEPFGRIFVDGKDFLRGAVNVGSYEPIGGNVSDYWLNQNAVVRVGTVYYTNGKDHFEREEWYELMTPKRAYQEDRRGPALQDGKATSDKK